MKLPGAEAAEFILLVPFTPTNRDNMISWLAARSDPPHYGNLILYQFPKQKLIYGPRQIEARIDQDPEISEQITLWGQAGSEVVRGNLLVIPIGNSLMYVEPLYLQAENGQLPELKRVIVSYENRLAMRHTLDEALADVFGGSGARSEEGGEPVEGAPQDRSESATQLGTEAGWARLASQASAWFQKAESAQREGDWAAYGDALSELEMTLKDLQTLSDGDDAAPGQLEQILDEGGEEAGEEAPEPADVDPGQQPAETGGEAAP